MTKKRFYFEHEVDLSKPKKTVYDEIFRKRYNGEVEWIPFGDLPKDLEPTDLIDIHREEAFFSEDNSYDAHSELTVNRPRLETDEEQKERLEKSQAFMEELHKRRYETYLKLKSEFEEPLKPIM